jgi:hypothetical protein
MLQDNTKQYQWMPASSGSSMQHECDTETPVAAATAEASGLTAEGFRAVSGGAAGRALICSIFLLSISLLSFWATDKAEQAAAGPGRQGEEIDRRISLPGPYHQGDASPFVRW